MTRLLETPYLLTPDTNERVYLSPNVEVRTAAIDPNRNEMIVLEQQINHHSRPQSVTVVGDTEPFKVPTFLIVQHCAA